MAVTAFASIAGLVSPVVAFAAPGGQEASETKAVQSAESSQEDKVRAAAVLGIVAGDDLLILNDRNFVFALWRKATGSEVRASAELALGGADAECTQWIKTGIHEAKKRDDANELRDTETARIARELKQSAAAVVGFVATPDELVRSYRDFVYLVYQKSKPDTKVRAGALAAFGEDEAAQVEFLRNGVLTAQKQDQQDEIDRNNEASEAEKARLAARDAKARAMGQVLGVVATEGILGLSDDNFIREVWNRAKPGTEVAAAAVEALRSPEPAVWKAFIDTGIYQADARDKELELKKQAEADRRRALEIQTKAEKSLVHPGLVYAAKTALAGSDSDVSRFVRIGQYQWLGQSLQSDTVGVRGWYVRNGADGPARIDPGNPVPGPGVGADANWQVLPGKADPNCHTFEVTGRPGVYLRQDNLRVVVAPGDGSEKFLADATWCSRTGLHGAGVSLESFSARGRFLRHINGELFAADRSGANWFDNPSWYEADASWRVHGLNPVTTALSLRWLNDDPIRARIGDPVTEEQVDGDVRWRGYQRGRLYWTKEAGAKEIEGYILESYLKLGGHQSNEYGVPVTDETGTPDGVGRFNHFLRGGSIYWTPSTGAHPVYGAIKQLWKSMDWERSYLGYPTGDPVYSPGLVRQVFQGGRIDHNPDTGATTAYRH
ncbi:AbfB domain-containing protein [Amycolatopsis nigrescens]|uniref:AbfB domain-containing protein n=1 Tax=Amycolatopsis nigrescens TaxID=381445 RepID=UPI0003A249B1|nr:AbfB domain-containing protein [Amycolatopsis nigrescens]